MLTKDSNYQTGNFMQIILSVFSILLFYALSQWLLLSEKHYTYGIIRQIFFDQSLSIFSFLILVSILNHKLTGKSIQLVTQKIFLFTPLILIAFFINISEKYWGNFYRNIFSVMDPGLFLVLLIGYFLFMKSVIKNSINRLRVLYGFFIYPFSVLLVIGVPFLLKENSFPIASHLFVALMTLIVGGFWYFLYNSAAFLSLIHNFRWLRIIHYCFMLTFGIVIYFYVDHTSFQTSILLAVKLIAGYLAVIFSWFTVVNVNDKYDLKADQVLHLDRPLVSGVIPQPHFDIVSKIYFLGALYFSSLINLSFFLITLIMIGIAYSYSAPPFRFKKYPFVATFILATVNLMITFLGFLILSSEESLSAYPIQIMLMIWIIFTLSNNSKDIRDYEGDKADGVITLPTLLGLKLSKIVIGLLILFSYLLAPLFLEINELYPFALVFGLITFWLINRKKVEDIQFYLCYFAYFLIVITSMIIQMV